MCFGELGHSHEKTKRKGKKMLFQKIAAKKIFEKKKPRVCEIRMPPKHPSFEKHDPHI